MKAEIFYNGFMLCLITTLASDYIIESEKESGSSRPDVIMVPRVGRQENPIIIEYKVSKVTQDLGLAAKAGLQQINEKRYDAKLKKHEHVKKVIMIALAFCGKEVALEYQVDEVA